MKTSHGKKTKEFGTQAGIGDEASLEQWSLGTHFDNSHPEVKSNLVQRCIKLDCTLLMTMIASCCIQ